MRDNTANSLASELDGGRRAAYIVPVPELSTPLTLEAGRAMRAAEGLSNISAVVALPCGDGTGALVATHHGAARQGEKSRSRMAFAMRRANVRAVGEDLDVWMGLGYYANRDRS
jgi:hypothetical protein